MILDRFFLKYEEGVKLTPLPQKKLPSKSPALLVFVIKNIGGGGGGGGGGDGRSGGGGGGVIYLMDKEIHYYY